MAAQILRWWQMIHNGGTPTVIVPTPPSYVALVETTTLEGLIETDTLEELIES